MYCRNRPVERAIVKSIFAKQYRKVKFMYLGISQNLIYIIPDEPVKKDWKIDNEANCEDYPEIFFMFDKGVHV